MKKNKQLSAFLQRFSIFIVLIVMFLVCSLLSPYFLKTNNLMNIARQLCVGILIAYGEMILIVSGFLDLSVGSVLALAGVLSVACYKATGSMALAILVALLVGMACNLFNGIFVAQFEVPAFIATLGMQQIARGILLYRRSKYPADWQICQYRTGHDWIYAGSCYYCYCDYDSRLVYV